MTKDFTIPEEVGQVSDALQHAGFEAYLVGGCVRDLIRRAEPNDWDLTTNATPEQIQELFEHTYYENTFGTVGVVMDDATDPKLKNIEVTTYRLEGAYSDHRRPDEVTFSDKVEDDLKRRDFTMNAIALTIPEGERTSNKGTFVDPFDGVTDIDNKVITAVGEPKERFQEDALRMMRAVRFSAQLGYILSKTTGEAILELSGTIKDIAWERIRDEFEKLIMSNNPKQGIELLHDLKLLSEIVPELEEGIGIDQNQAHSFDVWEHLLRSLQATADKDWHLELRLTALFHDIGKPRTRRHEPKKNDWSFHGHEVVGSRMTRKILGRLKFPNDTITIVTKLVRWHMFFSDPDEISLSAVRRMIRNVGTEYIWDLMNVRIADRVGTGRPKEQPYRFRKYQSMIEEVLRDPVTVGMLNLNGDQIIELNIEKPGKRMGWILHALLEEVLDDPKKNDFEILKTRAVELAALPDAELKKLGEAGKDKQEKADAAAVKELRDKYHVK